MNEQEACAAKLRSIPPVDRLKAEPALRAVVEEFGDAAAVRGIRAVLDAIRDEVRAGGDVPPAEEIAACAAAQTIMDSRVQMRHVINAAGIILHTGLGRAALPKAAVDALCDAAQGYCNLAFDLEKGERTERCRYIERLLCEITGAEAAHVVNNNAAATVIALNTLGEGREGIVSRGQLVEIGGAFRIPDVMARSGVKLVEVGTTNRTHLRDYEQAITDDTAMFLRVHHSNYRIVGFAGDVPIEEMAELAHSRGIEVMDDLGSGAFLDFGQWGLDAEPYAQRSVQAGADLITFSADKLIGGPQGGIILGRKDVINRLRKNPWARILRVGKLDLVALEATLRLFLDKDRLLAENPTLRMMRTDIATLTRDARRLAAAIRRKVPDLEVEVIDEHSQIGSGSMPTRLLPTKAVAIRQAGVPADQLACDLRHAEPPVFTRVQEGRVVLDVRTVLEGEMKELADAVEQVCGGRE